MLCEPIYYLQNTELSPKQNTFKKTGRIIPISPQLYTIQKIITKIVFIKMHILCTFFYSLESNAKLRIDEELSDHKNTVKRFTNFGRFLIIFLVLKKAQMGQCLPSLIS